MASLMLGAFAEPAAAVELTSPGEGAVVETSRPVLTWDLRETESGSFVSVFDRPPGEGVAAVWRHDAYLDETSGASNSVRAEGLSPGVYYWMVRAEDEEEGTVYSPVRSFTVAAPRLERLSVRTARRQRAVRIVTRSAEQARVRVTVHRRGRRVFRGATVTENGTASFRVRVDCLRPAAHRYVVTATDAYGKRLTRRGRFRVGCRVLFASRCFDSRYKPSVVILACGDGNLYLTGMRWTGWNRRTVRGSGTVRYNDCIPYCAAGQLRSTAARARLSRRRWCSGVGGYRYTRLRVSAATGAGTYPFPCRLYELQ